MTMHVETRPEHEIELDPVDEAGLESFPASDPPSWWPGPDRMDDVRADPATATER